MTKVDTIKKLYEEFVKSNSDVLFSESSFIEKLLLDSTFHSLYDRWVLGNFSEEFSPKISSTTKSNIQLSDIYVVSIEHTKKVDFEDLERFRLEEKPKRSIRKNGVEVKNPTSTNTWKQFERTVANDFGTTRSALSGAIKTITNSDTLHPHIYVECKLRGGDTFKFLEEFEIASAVHNDLPVCLKSGNFLLFSSSDFFKALTNLNYKVLDTPKIPKSILSLYNETHCRAEIEAKIPVVAIKKKNQKGYYLGTMSNQLVNFKNLLEIV